MSGSAGLFNKNTLFFTSSGAQRWAERDMGNTKQNTATLLDIKSQQLCVKKNQFIIDEDGIRTHAGKPQWISSPSP